MDRTLVLIVFAFAFLNLAEASATTSPSPTQSEIRTAVINRFQAEREFKAVEVYQHPTQRDIFAVLWDDGFWFKSLRVLKFKDGAIEWASEIDPKSNWGDHAILTVKWSTLPKIGITALEIYTSTHKGNGAYMVFQLDGQKLQELLNVRAIGRYDYGQRVPRLPGVDSVEANRVGRITNAKDDPFEEIEVSGMVQFFDESGKNVVKTGPLKQVFKWNPAKKVFEEDIAKRKGDVEFLSI